jgi:hypothetical protein
VAFPGHMIDHPLRFGRATAAVPARTATGLRDRAAIRAKLNELNATVGYCSGACRSDIARDDVRGPPGE